MRILVTGARRWPDRTAVFQALSVAYGKHGAFQLMHGACPVGADAFAHEWFEMVGKMVGCTELRFPAKWERPDGSINRAAGFERNDRMVKEGADLVLAFPLPEGKGTQHTMTLARKAGIKVISHKGAAVTRIPPQRKPEGL